MGWVVTEFPLDLQRILVITADSTDELNELVMKANRKGWESYVAGTVPQTGKPGLWMVKDI